MSICALLLGLSVAVSSSAAAELPSGAACPHLHSLSRIHAHPGSGPLIDSGLPIGAGDLDWDDDGDCFCEVGPCEGSVRSSCGQLQDGDCLDNPTDSRSVHVNPAREEACDDMVDNDCNGLVNDGCSNTARYATVQGGGCASSTLALLPLSALLLVLPMALRRRSSPRVAPRS